jgi:protocatechuate 3,4-dioxygenase beta subunit
MHRTEFLKRGFTSLLGLAAINPLLVACQKNPDTSAVSPDGSANGQGTDNGSSASNCTNTPAETAGPYPTKQPANFVRKDIREGRTGAVLTMTVTVKNKATGCGSLAGVMVDVWHCDAAGAYSEYGSLTSVDFLRGRQTTDANGQVTFTSIFPGWYPGRAPHIHIQVFSASGRSLLVSQIAFPYDVTDTVYTTGQSYGYTKGKQDTTNERDGIFSDGFATELATVSGKLADGYTLAHTLVVNG